MEFGKHITKGLWAFADKSLPALYGVGFICLVGRVLPEKEFGSFVLIQTLFTMATAFCTALALQPLTKFAAETKENGSYIVASLVFSVLFYLAVTGVLLVFHPLIVPLLDKRGETNLGGLIGYIPLLFITSLYRTFAISLLQASYRIKHIFWIDAVYFLGTMAMIVAAQKTGRFSTADDVVIINIVAQAASTLLAIILTRDLMKVKLGFDRGAFRKMWDFGKYSFGANVSYILFSQADVFFLGAFSGVISVAIYNAAKLFTRIFDMVGQVIQMFLMPLASKYSKLDDSKVLQVAVEKIILYTSILLLPVLITMVVFPDYIVAFLYKNRYQESAILIRVFGLLALIVPWNSACANIVMGVGRVKAGFFITSILFILATLLYLALIPRYGALGCTIAYVGSFFIVTIIAILYTNRIVNLSLKRIIYRVFDIKNYINSKL